MLVTLPAAQVQILLRVHHFHGVRQSRATKITITVVVLVLRREGVRVRRRAL